MFNTDNIENYQDISGDLGDTTYRKQLLYFFNLKEYDDNEIIKKTNELYEMLKNNNNFVEIFKLINANNLYATLFKEDEGALIILLSFDYFYNFYLCFKDYINKNDSKENVELLKNLILKNN